MNKEQKNSLLAKYYKGETTLEEEVLLKEDIFNMDESTPESDAFGFYNNESIVPENLEKDIFNNILEKNNKRKNITRMLYSITSAAAVIIIALSVYLDFRSNKFQEMENQFFVMEQAMYRVSETFQPEVQEEMLVLWVDNDVEIIIN